MNSLSDDSIMTLNSEEQGKNMNKSLVMDDRGRFGDWKKVNLNNSIYSDNKHSIKSKKMDEIGDH